MIAQAFVHAILSTALSTAIVASPLQATEPKPTHHSVITKHVVSDVSDVASIEQHWRFTIENYRMQHHNSWQTLNMTVNCNSNNITRTRQILAIYSEISHFLRTYPNEDDYWEIVNRELTGTTLQHHPDLSSITVILEVLPTELLPYTRASIVTQYRSGERTEGWRFTSSVPVQIRGDHLGYEVEYWYQNGITNTEYPDFVPINDRTTQLLMTAIDKGDTWEYTNQRIAESILQKYPVLYSFTSRIKLAAKKQLATETKEVTQ